MPGAKKVDSQKNIELLKKLTIQELLGCSSVALPFTSDILRNSPLSLYSPLCCSSSPYTTEVTEVSSPCADRVLRCLLIKLKLEWHEIQKKQGEIQLDQHIDKIHHLFYAMKHGLEHV